MANGKRKIAVIGAGNVGATCAFGLAQMKLGDVVMLDIYEGFAKGKALDMSQDGQVLNYDGNITGTANYEDIAGADVVWCHPESYDAQGMAHELACIIAERLGWAVMVLAVSWAAAIGGTALVMVVTGPRHARLAGFGAILASDLLDLAFGRTAWVTSAGQPNRVTVIQNNVPLNEKWSPNAVESIVEEYLVASRDSPASDLLIWPEAALPLYLDEIRDDDLMQLRRFSADVLLGVLERRQIKDKIVQYNSALGLGDRDMLYRKQQLVPFGEYLPFLGLFGWVLNYLQIPMSDFTAWPDIQLPMPLAGQKVAVSICYEDAFPAVIRRSLPAATLLVNLSEDAWFGDSFAPRQRLQIAQTRALEVSRPLIRANNNGLSALIDHRGRVVTLAPMFRADILRGELQPMRGATPFVRFGNIPLIALLGLLLAGCLVIHHWMTSQKA